MPPGIRGSSEWQPTKGVGVIFPQVSFAAIEIVIPVCDFKVQLSVLREEVNY